MNIRDYTEEELQAELDRKKRLKDKPKQIHEPNLQILKKVADEFIDNVLNGTAEETDYKYQFYVVSLKAIYGEDIFEWVRNNE